MFGVKRRDWDRIIDSGSYFVGGNALKKQIENDCKNFISSVHNKFKGYAKNNNFVLVNIKICSDGLNAYFSTENNSVFISERLIAELYEIYKRLPSEQYSENEKDTLFRFSLYYIISHELGHYYGQHNSNDVLDNTPFLKSLRYQRCFEMNADIFAIGILCDIIELNCEKNNCDRLRLNVLLITSIYCMFLTLQSPDEFIKLCRDEHPYSGFRFAYSISGLLERNCPFDMESICTIVAKANNEIIDVFFINKRKLNAYWKKIQRRYKMLCQIESDWIEVQKLIDKDALF